MKSLMILIASCSIHQAINHIIMAWAINQWAILDYLQSFLEVSHCLLLGYLQSVMDCCRCCSWTRVVVASATGSSLWPWLQVPLFHTNHFEMIIDDDDDLLSLVELHQRDLWWNHIMLDSASNDQSIVDQSMSNTCRWCRRRCCCCWAMYNGRRSHRLLHRSW